MPVASSPLRRAEATLGPARPGELRRGEARHGKELTPIRPYVNLEEFSAFGHLRLPSRRSKQLKRVAAWRRISVAELVRQVLEAGLR